MKQIKKVVYFNGVNTVFVNRNDNRIHFCSMRKHEAMDLLKNTILTQKVRKIIIWVNKQRFFKCIKKDKTFAEVDKKFGDTEIEKHKFHQHRRATLISDVNVIKIILSNKGPFW